LESETVEKEASGSMHNNAAAEKRCDGCRHYRQSTVALP
jgi:hypothetical protein